MLKHYEASEIQIVEHIKKIANHISAMNPVLIYLVQPSVREQQIWISSIRSKPYFATEHNIKFMENRKRIELRLLNELPFPTHTIENIKLDWEAVFKKMVYAIQDETNPSFN